MELTSVKCPTSVAGCTPFGGGYQTRRAHLFRSASSKRWTTNRGQATRSSTPLVSHRLRRHLMLFLLC